MPNHRNVLRTNFAKRRLGGGALLRRRSSRLMGSDLLPYELFIAELRTDEAERQLSAIARLRLIALALGPDKTCDPLVKNLAAWIDEHVTGDPSAPCPDEVLTCIAFNLGKFVADGLVGPATNLPMLVKPLERLCSVDETNVREEAVKSLNIICKRMEPAQVKSELQPIILGLAKNEPTGPWVPRVSACGLFATAMSKLSGDEGSSKELREAFKQLGIDETPMVRRAAALQLSEFAAALDTTLVTEDLLPLYRTLLADEQDSVRVNALKSTPKICEMIGALRKEVLDPQAGNFKQCVKDMSWRVRVACADVIGEVAVACKSDPDALELVKEHYKTLQEDNEAEVQVATALKSARATAVLGPEFGKSTIFPMLKSLVLDANTAKRLEMSGVVMDMAAPLGKALALELVMPCMRELISDKDDQPDLTNIRLAIIAKIAAFVDVVGTTSDDPKTPNETVKTVKELAATKNWRVRHAVLCQMPKFAKIMGEASFSSEFAQSISGAEYGAMDDYALIRTDWVFTMGEIAQLGFGAAWLSKHIVPVLEACKKEKKFQKKAVLLEGTGTLGPLLTPDDLMTKLMPLVLELCDDKVANLRVDAMKCLKEVCAVVPADYMKSQLVPKLNDKVTDEDPDVAHFAKLALDEFDA